MLFKKVNEHITRTVVSCLSHFLLFLPECRWQAGTAKHVPPSPLRFAGSGMLPSAAEGLPKAALLAAVWQGPTHNRRAFVVTASLPD